MKNYLVIILGAILMFIGLLAYSDVTGLVWSIPGSILIVAGIIGENIKFNKVK